MKFALALVGATLSGSLVVAGYNWLLERLVPDTALLYRRYTAAEMEQLRAAYAKAGIQNAQVPSVRVFLDLDDVARVAAIALAAVPLGMMIHKIPVVGAVVPAPK